MARQSNAASPAFLDRFIAKMRLEHLPDAGIDVFALYYKQLANNTAATIPESSITPVDADSIKDSAGLQNYCATGIEALKKTVVIKLNGGLGTTMGLKGPKSLIKAKNGLSFLEISIHQIRHVNDRQGCVVPLILMNSFFTDTATREALAQFRDLPSGPPETFLQHKFPKVLATTLEPPSVPGQPSLEWNPAGHGNLLLSIATSGLLDRLLHQGYRYLFVSNIDNLGAEISTEILGHFASEKFDFLMEVTDRTPMDRKGGHLAKSKNGGLLLRESAQCSDVDRNSFSDISRHRFFNTNNLWLNLESVRRAVDNKKYEDMPLILNRKKLDPSDPGSPEVFQLESALGSSILLFEKSGAVRVPRSRFAPVKNCDELLLAWSDYYVMRPDYRIAVNPARTHGGITVSLDPGFFSSIDLLESRFPSGAPSLVDCSSFSVTGDVKFGRGVTLHGAVSITNTSGRQVIIEDNADISKNIVF